MRAIRTHVQFVTFVLALTFNAAAQGGAAPGAPGQPLRWEAIDDGSEFSVAMPAGYESVIDGGYFIPPSIDIDKHLSVTRLVNRTFLMVELYTGDVKDLRKELISRITKLDEPFTKVDEKTLETAEMQEFRQAKNGHTRIQRFYLTKKKLYIVQAVTSGENDPIAAGFLESVRIGKQDGARKLPVGIREETSAVDLTPISGDPDRELVIVAKPRPSYPSAARAAGASGDVVLRTLFSANGKIARIEPKSGSRELTKAASDAAMRIRFIPAEKDGRLVSVWKEITYTFSIY